MGGVAATTSSVFDTISHAVEPSIRSRRGQSLHNPRFIKLSTLKACESLPRYPNDLNLTVSLTEIPLDLSLVVFISHVWITAPTAEHEGKQQFWLLVK